VRIDPNPKSQTASANFQNTSRRPVLGPAVVRTALRCPKTRTPEPPGPDELPAEITERIGICCRTSVTANVPSHSRHLYLCRRRPRPFKDLAALKESNDYGAQLVAEHPARFGLLAALPTDDPDACLAEIERGNGETHPDGYAVTTLRNGVHLSDDRLEPVWAELDRRYAVVFVHPSTDMLPQLGLPTPLIEVAFETARAMVGLLYAGVLRRYPNVKIILAHCGGALPALSGRLGLLGESAWVSNPQHITRDEIAQQLSRFYLDTAASGTDANLAAALAMAPRDHLVYGADSGVPCNNEASLDANLECLLNSSVLRGDEADQLGHRAFDLFPDAARRHYESRTSPPRSSENRHPAVAGRGNR
jgi:predicted TIM-barrel fold metal-dependent hydrolase